MPPRYSIEISFNEKFLRCSYDKTLMPLVRACGFGSSTRYTGMLRNIAVQFRTPPPRSGYIDDNNYLSDMSIAALEYMGYDTVFDSSLIV